MDFQLSREKSRKTEEVFLVGSRESEGKSKSPQALFLLPAFSFGEAKENAVPHLQICCSASAFMQFSRNSRGFPYEGKLSPEATDEVDSAAQMQVPPPHPSRLSPCHFPLVGEAFEGG